MLNIFLPVHLALSAVSSELVSDEKCDTSDRPVASESEAILLRRTH
jgi:hypothetical protein